MISPSHRAYFQSMLPCFYNEADQLAVGIVVRGATKNLSLDGTLTDQSFVHVW
jgi:hypothetical protein